MTKRYTLPTVTAYGQDASIEILVDDVKLREWLYYVRGHIGVENFRFQWAENPHITPFRGHLHAVYRRDGIYIEARLFWDDYRNGLYSLDEFCRMTGIKGTRPSLGWCVTVTVQ